MATIHRTVSIGSLSSITSEEFTQTQRKNTRVTVGFKQHWFETTLNFVKDERRMSINYGVTPAQAVFIRDVLSFEVNPSLRFENYAPLYEALKIFGLKYYFKLKMLKKDLLILQKIPKPFRQFLEPDSSKTLSPKMEREKKVIDRISHEYMVEKSQTILDFIDDPTRATLEFTKVKPLESMFLQTVMTAARPLFPEHAQMLEHVKKLKPKLDFSLQVLIGKINKKTNERSVTFKKDPRFSKKGKRNRDSSLNRSNISLDNNFVPSTKEQSKSAQNIANNKENSAHKLNSMEIEQNGTNSIETGPKSTLNNANSVENVQNSMQSGQILMKAILNSTQTVQNSMQNAQNSMQSGQNSMQFEQNSQEAMEVDSPRSVDTMNSCSATSVQSEPVSVVARTPAMGCSSSVDKTLGNQYGSQSNLNQPRRDTTGLNPRKAKLLEAMSVPVQIDNAAKMMHKMGWTGGPLGVRGVGITEPIIPTLDLVAGAGFGHVKPVVPVKSAKPVTPVNPVIQVHPVMHVNPVNPVYQANPVKLVNPVTPANPAIQVNSVKPVNPVYQVNPAKPVNPKVGQENFRQELLETILDLVQTEKVTVSLVYPNMMSKKEITFARRTVTSFSERKKLTLKNCEEARVAKLVVDALKRLPDVVIHGTASECKKQLTLKKVVTAKVPDHLPVPGVIKLEHLNKLADSVQGNTYAYKSPKQKRYLGTRITILMEILHFLQSDLTLKQLVFEATLSTQERQYITKGVDSLNKGKKPAMCQANTMEDDLCNNIHKVMGDSILSVQIDDRKVSVLFLKLQIKPYNKSDFNELQSTNKNTNSTVRSTNGNNLSASAMVDLTKNITPFYAQTETVYVINPNINISNNIAVTVQNNLNASKNNENKQISSETNAEKNNTVENGVNDLKKSFNNTNSRSDSEYINKILEKRLKNLDESKTEKDVNATKDMPSEDDDVILIETVHEIVVISDDESDDTSTKIDEILKKQGNVDVSQVYTNSEKIHKETDSNITQWSADMSISNTQGSGEIDMTRGSADMTISISQDSIASLDISKVHRSTDIDETNERTSITNSINNTDFDISRIREKDVTEGSADNKLNNHDTSKLDVSNGEEKAKIEMTKGIIANISISSENKSTQDIPKIDALDGEGTEKTDIKKIILKVEPKKEKLSYSEEFDKDLYDLEQVLLLDDDDVFDYTIVKKEESIDKFERPSSKRSRSDSVESSPDNSKKTKVFTFKNSKNLLIVPKDYPDVDITKEGFIKIQTILSDAIEICKELPLLKCHGIQDGGLLYSCHNEKSLFFIEKSLSVVSDYKTINDVVIKKRPYKMRVRFNSLLDNIKTLLSRLELYNAGLITDYWCVTNTQKYDDYIVISVEIDESSYKYICDNSFCLYAGIDEARFSVVWD